MLKFDEETINEIMGLVIYSKINGVLEAHVIDDCWVSPVNCSFTTLSMQKYLFTNPSTITTGLCLRVKYQYVGEISYWKNFYSIEEPIIYV